VLRGVLAVVVASGVACAPVSARIGFESADHRVHCAFRRIFSPHQGLPGTRAVECTSDAIRQAASHNSGTDEYSPCLDGGENAPELLGPGAVQLRTWGHTTVLIGCYVRAKRFRALMTGEAVAYGVIRCFAVDVDAISCRSSHSGRDFTITPTKLARR
jgi:hypothetical protein